MNVKQLLLIITVSYIYQWEDPKHCISTTYYDDIRDSHIKYNDCNQKKWVTKTFKTNSEAREFLNKSLYYRAIIPWFGFDLKPVPRNRYVSPNFTPPTEYFYNVQIKKDNQLIWKQNGY